MNAASGNDTARKHRVAALGECMIELRQGAGQALSFGFAGDTLNTATYLRRLLAGDAFDVEYVSALGDDPLSAQMIAGWQAEGIGTGLVRRIDGELPGIYWIRTDDKGEREFHYWRSASAARQLFTDGYGDCIADALRDARLLYVSGISLAILPPAQREELLVLLSALRRAGTTIACDSNYRARLWRDAAEAGAFYRRVLPEVDILISSHVDEAAMFGDADIGATAERIAAFDVPEWVIRGAPGVTVTRQDGETAVEPLDPQQVIDTTGAGDSFDAAYLAARLSGHGIREAVAAGHALASVVVQHGGAIIAAESTPSLQALLDT